MKIRDIQTGELYQLAPGSTLEIERTNPFFNDYGEQSLPMDLPDTPQNRRLTGHPAELANSHRPPSGRYVEIEDGAYHVRARQMILSARRHGSISTSYLLEQSDLYARIGDARLIDVFAGMKILEDETLDDIIGWLDSLKSHENDNFDIFPIALTDTESAGQGFGYRLLNARGRIFTHFDDATAHDFYPEPLTGDSSHLSQLLWLNAADRSATPFINAPGLCLQKGYYMTPFIRAIYVLKVMLEHFGYNLVQHSSTLTDPVIMKMVFVNNTIDSIVTGNGILLSDLVPDCSCSDLLDLFRYKFGMEFVCDDTAGTVTMLPFTAMAEAVPTDLTPYLADEPDIEYADSPRRVVLTPASALSGEAAPAVTDILKKYACPSWNDVLGGWVVNGKRGCWPVTELVIDGNAGYDIGQGYDTTSDADATRQTVQDEKTSPDTIPSFIALKDTTDLEHRPDMERHAWTFPFIGEGRALHSRLDSEPSDDSNPELQERPELPMLLMLPFSDYRSYPRGGLTGYDYYKYYMTGDVRSVCNGSLCYHGDKGLFERYWRIRDDLDRSAMNTVRTRLLLPAELKMKLSPLSPVLIRSTPLLIDSLNVVLGEDNAESESTLLTMSRQEPLSTAPQSRDLPASTGYHWQLKRSFATSSTPADDNPERVYQPSLSGMSAGDTACTQYQVTKLRDGQALGIRYDVDNDTATQEVMPLITGSWDIANTTGQDIYLHITSWFECVADPEE